MPEKEVVKIASIWTEIGANMGLLAIAGSAGAIIKAIIAPEKQWRRRALQGVVGVVSAVFLGGLLGGFVEAFVSQAAYAYLASGFICGTAGESVIAWAQRKFLGTGK